MSNNKRTTKEQLIRSIARDSKLSVRDVRLVYNSLEYKIKKLLEEVNSKQNVEIKVFEGITIEGKYIPKDKRINNLTGQEFDFKEKIRPHVKVSRRYYEKLNKML